MCTRNSNIKEKQLLYLLCDMELTWVNFDITQLRIYSSRQ